MATQAQQDRGDRVGTSTNVALLSPRELTWILNDDQKTFLICGERWIKF